MTLLGLLDRPVDDRKIVRLWASAVAERSNAWRAKRPSRIIERSLKTLGTARNLNTVTAAALDEVEAAEPLLHGLDHLARESLS